MDKAPAALEMQEICAPQNKVIPSSQIGELSLLSLSSLETPSLRLVHRTDKTYRDTIASSSCSRVGILDPENKTTKIHVKNSLSRDWPREFRHVL